MAFNGINKAFEVIRLDDSEGSPTFRISFTDSSIMGKQALINSLRNDMEELGKRASDPETDMDRLQKDLAVCYGSIINAFLGKDATGVITEYVTDGEDIPQSEINVLVSPLVLYLLERYAEVAMPAGMREAARKYLDEEPTAL